MKQLKSLPKIMKIWAQKPSSAQKLEKSPNICFGFANFMLENYGDFRDI